jgi:hypothetical protein
MIQHVMYRAPRVLQGRSALIPTHRQCPRVHWGGFVLVVVLRSRAQLDSTVQKTRQYPYHAQRGSTVSAIYRKRHHAPVVCFAVIHQPSASDVRKEPTVQQGLECQLRAPSIRRVQLDRPVLLRGVLTLVCRVLLGHTAPEEAVFTRVHLGTFAQQIQSRHPYALPTPTATQGLHLRALQAHYSMALVLHPRSTVQHAHRQHYAPPMLPCLFRACRGGIPPLLHRTNAHLVHRPSHHPVSHGCTPVVAVSSSAWMGTNLGQTLLGTSQPISRRFRAQRGTATRVRRRMFKCGTRMLKTLLGVFFGRGLVHLVCYHSRSMAL